MFLHHIIDLLLRLYRFLLYDVYGILPPLPRALAPVLVIQVAFRFAAVRTQGFDEGKGVAPGTERQV